ncbi:MAG: amidophosphoribosyltransferase [Acidimicrobiia bacterium]|nr:amidophosphoribosyltransferase [Acidimicrobiia bacterium]
MAHGHLPSAVMARHPLDPPGEACGVFGIYSPRQRVSPLIYFGLSALQHRGQESAGIATSDGNLLTVHRDMGLVAQVFDEPSLAALDGHVGIGHTRYSTTGATVWENSQPVHRQIGDTSLALAHNGNLTNTAELAEGIDGLRSTSDSHVMAESIARAVEDGRSDARGLENAILEVIPTFEGAFCLVAMDQGRLIAARDSNGFRPLCLGELPDEEGYVVASETAALDLVGARYVREVEPGEVLVIDASGVRSFHPFPKTNPTFCVFEYVYFARPDTRIGGVSVHAARQRMGVRLAREHPAHADLVVPVPESGIPAAQGFSRQSGIPYGDGLVKNRYVGRTFIEPNQLIRDQGIRMKLNPIPENLVGRRVVLVDDSIVRGSTTRKLIRLVRSAGADEVHVRISSPPYRWPCFYGMDTGDRSTLIAANMEIDEIRDHIGADSIGYLSVDGLVESIGNGEGHCTACLTGEYPAPIPEDSDKLLLEKTR